MPERDFTLGPDAESGATVAFLGDIFLGEGELDLHESVRRYLVEADLVVANLESPITAQPMIDSGKILLRAAPGTERSLSEWGVGLVTLANNHTCDCGWPGLRETMSRLEALAVRHVGAGADLAEATRPVVAEVRGLRLGFLACAWEGTQAHQASAEDFGCARLEEALIVKQIEQLKSECDHVIVLPHWGYCDYEYPTASVHRLGKRIIEAGATAVVGHHSHIVQGVLEVSAGRLVAYSVGDFMFSAHRYAGKTVKTRRPYSRGVILKLQLDRSGVVHVAPYFTEQVNNTILPDSRLLRRRQFERISRPLRSDDYGRYWRAVVRKRLVRRAIFWLCPWNWWRLHKSTFFGLWIMLKEFVAKKPPPLSDCGGGR